MIQVVEQPLAGLPVDAVVRAADETLGPVGLVSRQLDAAAGPAGEAQRRVQAPLQVGAAVITGAGDLAAEFILHVVVQDADRPATRETLRRALASAWHRAEGWQLRSVGAALSGLVVGDDDAAHALVESFRDRPDSTGFPAELHVTIDRPEQRQALAPWLGDGAR